MEMNTAVESVNLLTYDYIQSDDKYANVIKAVQKCSVCALDTETTGLDVFTSKILLLQLNIDGKVFILNCVKPFSNRLAKYVLELLKERQVLIVGHNLKFDIKVVYRNFGVLLTNVFDTMIAELVLTAGLFGKFPSLADLVAKYIGEVLSKEDRLTFVNWPHDYFTEQQLIYAARDVIHLHPIMYKQMDQLEIERTMHVNDLERSLIPVFGMMEYEGIDLDRETWLDNSRTHVKLAEEKKIELLNYITDHIDFSQFETAASACDAFGVRETTAGVKTNTKRYHSLLETISGEFCKQWVIENLNLNSHVQLKNVFQLMGYPVANTDEKNLATLQYDRSYSGVLDFVGMLLDYREHVKKVSTYGEAFLELINPVTGKIHTEFNQVVSTGRISSENPNLTNIPRELDYRKSFVAPPGWLILGGDYSQAEYRLAASVSGEPVLIEAFKRDVDFHSLSASILHQVPVENVTKDQRLDGKKFNFGLNYGVTAWGLMRNLGVTQERGQELLDTYWSTNKVLYAFNKYVEKMVLERYWSITPFGRKRYFKKKELFTDYKERDKYLARIGREGKNHVIQGGVADIVKLAMKECFYTNPFGDKLRLILQVHDELVFLVHESVVEEAKKFVEDVMIRNGQKYITEVPVKVDVEYAQHWKK